MAIIEDYIRNLKVMRLQDALNNHVRNSLEGKVLYNSVKEYIPELCQFLKTHPLYEQFRDLKISEIIDVWEVVAILPKENLKETIKIMEKRILELGGQIGENPGSD